MVGDDAGRGAGRPYFLPNKMGRVHLLALESVMGRSALHAVLSHAGLRHLINNFPSNTLDLGWRFDDVAALQASLEQLHGEGPGRALAIRAGRASLHYLHEDFRSVLGVSERALGLLPLVPKLRSGLRALSDLYNKTSDQLVCLEESGERFLFRVDRCPICWGRKADAPICRAQVGLLQEAMHWVTGGQHVAVDEIECLAQGAPSCTYAVEKRPLG